MKTLTALIAAALLSACTPWTAAELRQPVPPRNPNLPTEHLTDQICIRGACR